MACLVEHFKLKKVDEIELAEALYREGKEVTKVKHEKLAKDRLKELREIDTSGFDIYEKALINNEIEDINNFLGRKGWL